MDCLNLGIVAHVDAGKTTLTERLLFSAGVIDAMGSVDAGSTQTDSLALERKRGITIKSAVVSFVVQDVAVNLIDTPGHPDFIAEVERVLGVLDGAVLVISAVEGVQAQTRVLMRALQRLHIPTLLFVNKIDRGGAQYERLLHSIAEKLSPAIVPMGATRELGTRRARYAPYGAGDAGFQAALVDLLSRHDDALLGAYVDDERAVSYPALRRALAAHTRQARMHPVFFGSAATGAGVDALIAGVTELLPATAGDALGPVAGTVFKVERGPAGEKIAYARMFSGTVHVRDRLPVGPRGEGKVTAIRVFERGTAVRRASVAAGQIGKLWGLGDVRIGDAIGVPAQNAQPHAFAPPALETVVVPRGSGHMGALQGALLRLAEQDPLINLRQDDVRQELYLSLYGEVQKEVIQETLASDFHLEVDFRETTPIYIERPAGSGAAVEMLGQAGNPFLATLGLRVEPAPINSGSTFRLDVRVESIPLYVFKSVEEFRKALEDTLQETLRQGLCGWQVTDCAITLTQCGYASPATGARDYRLLAPLVLMSALRQAGTRVCEPIQRFHLEFPADTLAHVLPALPALRAVPLTTAMQGASCLLDGEIPAVRVHALQQQLRALTRGEGVLECAFERYEAVRGVPPARPRSDHNPLNRKEYLLAVVRRVQRDGRGG